MRRSFTVVVGAMATLMSSSTWGGVSDTCVLEGGKHSAYYECPDGFDLLLTGQNTAHCDGRCVAPKKFESIKKGVGEALKVRSLTVSDAELEKITKQLMAKGTAEFQGVPMVLKLERPQ